MMDVDIDVEHARMLSQEFEDTKNAAQDHSSVTKGRVLAFEGSSHIVDVTKSGSLCLLGVM